MKATIIAIALVLIVGCITGGTCLAIRWSNNCRYQYTGREVFQTEQAYTAFKQAVVDANASIEGTSVLSSSPPIIVEFKITTEHNVVFPYGTKEDADGNWLIGLVLACLPTWLILVALSHFKWGRASSCMKATLTAIALVLMVGSIAGGTYLTVRWNNKGGIPL